VSFSILYSIFISIEIYGREVTINLLNSIPDFLNESRSFLKKAEQKTHWILQEELFFS